MMSEYGGLQILCLKGGEEWGSVWDCGRQLGSVGTCRYLRVSVDICGGPWGCAGMRMDLSSPTSQDNPQSDCRARRLPRLTAISTGQNSLQDWTDYQ